MNSNMKIGKILAKKFNKKNGIITYSGTLALEVALNNLKLEKDSLILVSSLVCYSIINTIEKVGYHPVIINPKNSLFLENEDIDLVLKKYDIKCILLVHQYGIINRIDKKKYKDLNIKIIEDIAQCFDIKNDYYEIGKNSDFVITSFGKTKPLSLGIGGAVLFDQVINNVDFYDNESRESRKLLLSYSFPLCDKINIKELFQIGKKNIKEQRLNSKLYYKELKKDKRIKIYYNNNDCFHRFILIINDYSYYKKIAKELKKEKFLFQLTHKIELKDLGISVNSKYIDNRDKKSYLILFRTRNVDIENQIKIIKKYNGVLFNNKCDIL